MEAIIKILDEEYIDEDFAVAKKIVSERTVRSIRTTATGQLRFKNRTLIPIKSLSATVQNRIQLIKVEVSNAPKGDESKHQLEAELILSFLHENPQRFTRYAPHYRKYGFSELRLQRCYTTHGLIQTLIGFKSQNYFVKAIYHAYRKLNEEHPFENFDCGDYDYFCAKLKEAEIKGIENVIINTKRFNRRIRRKFTKIHQTIAIKLYKDPNRYSYKIILQKLNDEVVKLGRMPVHISVLKKFLSDPEIQNRYKPFRIGKAWANEHLFPYLPIKKPKRVNSKWEMDSTRINYYVWEDEASETPRTYQLCIVVDVKSRKIIGFHIRPTEDALLNELALLSAVMCSGMLPKQLVHDNHASYTKSERFKELEKRIEDSAECIITLTDFYSPQQKGTCERINGILQSDYLRFMAPGWLGSNLGAKLDENRIDSRYRKDLWDGKGERLFVKDLFPLVKDCIEKYNRAEIWN